jgi:P27 family predicted phage terminase small subunit
MPTPRKLVSLQTKHLTKKERKERETAEKQYKANADGLDPPEWLPDIAKEEFRRVVKEAEGIGMLDNLDLSTLTIYAKNWAVFVSASKKIKAGGLVKKGSYISPYILVAEKAENALHKCSAKLGLAAVDRTRLVKPKEKEKPANKFARYMDA